MVWERKLAAILCSDAHGYRCLIGEDEEATLRTLTSHGKLVDSEIEQHRGRFVSSAGDSVLAELASVVEAVNCVEIQTRIETENANLPSARRMELALGSRSSLSNHLANKSLCFGLATRTFEALAGVITSSTSQVCISLANLDWALTPSRTEFCVLPNDRCHI